MPSQPRPLRFSSHCHLLEEHSLSNPEMMPDGGLKDPEHSQANAHEAPNPQPLRSYRNSSTAGTATRTTSRLAVSTRDFPRGVSAILSVEGKPNQRDTSGLPVALSLDRSLTPPKPVILTAAKAAADRPALSTPHNTRHLDRSAKRAAERPPFTPSDAEREPTLNIPVNYAPHPPPLVLA